MNSQVVAAHPVERSVTLDLFEWRDCLDCLVMRPSASLNFYFLSLPPSPVFLVMEKVGAAGSSCGHDQELAVSGEKRNKAFTTCIALAESHSNTFRF